MWTEEDIGRAAVKAYANANRNPLALRISTGGGHDIMQIISFSCGMISTNPTIDVTMCDLCDIMRHVTRHATA